MCAVSHRCARALTEHDSVLRESGASHEVIDLLSVADGLEAHSLVGHEAGTLGQAHALAQVGLAALAVLALAALTEAKGGAAPSAERTIVRHKPRRTWCRARAA